MKTSPATLLAFLLLPLAIANAQVQPSNKIAWESLPDYENLRNCLQSIFRSEIYFSNTPQRNVGCDTNTCLCRADVIAENKPLVYTQVFEACSNTEDAKSATGILDEYCSLNGYTSRIEAGEITTPQGACTATVTVTVTMFREKSGSDIRVEGGTISQSVLMRLGGILLTGFVGLL